MRFQSAVCFLFGVALGFACDVNNPSWIGDGYCDTTDTYNTESCEYDGGDCCEESCISSRSHTCGDTPYNCVDPRYQIDEDENDSFFVYIAEAKSWYEASSYCEVRGGWLADIKDSSEDQRAFDSCYQGANEYDYGGQDCWIGYHSDYNVREPHQWSSGSSYSYTNWDETTEPNESYDSCARYIYDSEYPYWYDRGCDFEFAFICEFRYEDVELTCNLQPTRNMALEGIEISGDIIMGLEQFDRGGGRVSVDIDISGYGIIQNDFHGIHIHEGRELTDDGQGCDGHFNPLEQTHACFPYEVRHVGDMGNIASYDVHSIEEVIKLDDVFEFVPDFVGRCIILHERRDTCQADPDNIASTGDAGGRYSQCLIDVQPRYKLLEREETPKSQYGNRNYIISGVAVGGTALAVAGFFVFVKRLRRKRYNRVETQTLSVDVETH